MDSHPLELMGHLCVLVDVLKSNCSLKGLRGKWGFNTSLYCRAAGSQVPYPPTDALPLSVTCHHPVCRVGSTWSIPSRPLPNPGAPSSLATGAVPWARAPPLLCLLPSILCSTAQPSHILDLSNSLEWKHDQLDVAEVPPLVAHPPHSYPACLMAGLCLGVCCGSGGAASPGG